MKFKCISLTVLPVKVGYIASVSHMAVNSTTWVKNTRIMLLRSREAQYFSRRTVGPTHPPIQSVPVFFPWCKAAECEVAHSSPYRMTGAILLLPHVPSWLGHCTDQTNHWAHPVSRAFEGNVLLANPDYLLLSICRARSSLTTPQSGPWALPVLFLPVSFCNLTFRRHLTH